MRNKVDASSGDVRLKDYLLLVRRGRWTIVITTAVVFALVAAYTFFTKPVYEATARVIIETKSRSEGPQSFLDLIGSSATTKITNELEILRSNSLSEGVAQSLLRKEYLDRASDKRIGIIAAKRDSGGSHAFASARQIAERLTKVLDFVPIKESDVIKIVAHSGDPQEAALIANTVAEVYVQRNLDMSRSRSRAIKDFLQEKLQEKQGSLTNAESALQSYMKTSGVVTLEGADRRVVEQLSQLEGSRDALDVEISARTQTLASLREELSKQEPNAARSITESNDAYVRQLQEHLAALEVQRDVLVAQNPNLQGQRIFSDKLKELNGEIDALRRNLQKRTKEFIGSLQPGDVGFGVTREGSAGFLAGLKQKIIEQQIELEGLTARKAALNKVIRDYEVQFNRIPQKSMDLAKLQRSRLSSEKLYLMVEEKYNEAAITETSELGYVNVFDPAIEPEDPISPKVLLNLLMAPIVGLGLGIALVLVRSSVVVVIHAPEDLKKIGYTPLAIIARMDSRALAASARQAAAGKLPGADPHLVALHQPFSPIAESYRHLRTSIEYARPERPVRTLVVTSAIAGEGKSTTAANLAIACAQLERKVLLADADMRRPRVHSLFGLPQDPGLVQFLGGGRDLEDCIVDSVVPHLDILVSGTPPLNPAELLGSKRMMEFVQLVTRRYDITIIDAPPVLDVTDAVAIGPKVDGTIMVIASGTARVDVLERATEVMERVGNAPLGVVLNRFDPLQSYGGGYGRRGYGYGYGYYASEKMQASGPTES